MSEWKPITDDVKTGAAILGYGYWAGEINGPDNALTTCVILWDGGRTDYPGYDWRVVHADGYAEWFKPLFWMPLPAAPKEAWQ